MNAIANEPATVPLPDGFELDWDGQLKQLDESTLFGGSPARLMRLTDRGRSAYAQLRAGPVRGRAGGILARRLTDAGLAQPRPAARTGPADVTVVVPAHGRAALLERCLAAQGCRHRVVVVDDGTPDRTEIARVAVAHGARLVRLDQRAGPGAARNAGLAQVRTEFVAFLDSDCRPEDDWIEALAGHFADPLVAAVAPRIVAADDDARASSVRRYAAVRGSLDLGPTPSRVVPATRVSYVPTAALLVRRAALEDLSGGAAGPFDPALRYGEDVDLIWRLHEAGWRVRYQPEVRIVHREPLSWPALLARRFRYGTSAGPLALRHPDSLAPLVLQPWNAVAVAALLNRRPILAAAGVAASVLGTTRTLRGVGLTGAGVLRPTLEAVQQTWLGSGRYLTQFAAPALAAALLVRPRPARAAAMLSLLAGPPVTEFLRSRPAMHPAAYLAGHLADDLAYGAGIYAGCLRARTTIPLRPRLAWRAFRVETASTRPTAPEGITEVNSERSAARS